MAILNIGVIGVGDRAKAHLNTLPKLSDKYRLAAVCDIDTERADRVALRMGVNAYTNLEEMLDKERLDVGLIAVQAEGHHVVARCLAEHNVHILTETPIALTLPCVDVMIEAAERNGVLVEVSENVGRWPHERLKQKIAASGLIGDIEEFYLSYRMGAYHGINAIRMITGREAQEVRADFTEEADVVERAHIRMEGSIRGVYENNNARGKYWAIHGTKGSLKGTALHLAGHDEPFEIVTETTGEGNATTVHRASVATQPEVEWVNPHRQYPLPTADDVACADTLISMYDAIVNGRPLGYDAREARKDTELLVAIRDSATRSGATVTLPLAGITEHERRLHAEFERVHGIDFLKIEPRQLALKYDLPPGLRAFLYAGRLPQKALERAL